VHSTCPHLAAQISARSLKLELLPPPLARPQTFAAAVSASAGAAAASGRAPSDAVPAPTPTSPTDPAAAAAAAAAASEDADADAIAPYFQRVEVRASGLLIDYRPRRVDVAALREGSFAELLNLTPWGGVHVFLKPLRLSGVQVRGLLGGAACFFFEGCQPPPAEQRAGVWVVAHARGGRGGLQAGSLVQQAAVWGACACSLRGQTLACCFESPPA
jgi:hypothetical protein